MAARPLPPLPWVDEVNSRDNYARTGKSCFSRYEREGMLRRCCRHQQHV